MSEKSTTEPHRETGMKLRTSWADLDQVPQDFDNEQIQINDWFCASEIHDTEPEDSSEFREALYRSMNLSDIEELIDSCEDTAIEHRKRAEQCMKLRERLIDRLSSRSPVHKADGGIKMGFKEDLGESEERG